MQQLTFGEQVKIILGRRGMTIKELAEKMESHTGKPMSRQNLTQRLHRDNFQEQDMRLIAKLLGCQFTLDIMTAKEEVQEEDGMAATVAQEAPVIQMPKEEPKEVTQEVAKEVIRPEETNADGLERDITVGELMDMQEGDLFDPAPEVEAEVAPTSEPEASEQAQTEQEELSNPPEEEKRFKFSGFRKGRVKTKETEDEAPAKVEAEPEAQGDINPYTGKEYASNSVRMHPKRIGYVQVYDQTEHKWTDMTEWAFLGFQERKKALLGKDYEPPIYLD